jgi:hypothetical protein
MPKAGAPCVRARSSAARARATTSSRVRKVYAVSVRSRASSAGTSSVPNERRPIVRISPTMRSISRRPIAWISRGSTSSVLAARQRPGSTRAPRQVGDGGGPGVPRAGTRCAGSRGSDGWPDTPPSSPSPAARAEGGRRRRVALGGREEGRARRRRGEQAVHTVRARARRCPAARCTPVARRRADSPRRRRGTGRRRARAPRPGRASSGVPHRLQLGEERKLGLPAAHLVDRPERVRQARVPWLASSASRRKPRVTHSGRADERCGVEAAGTREPRVPRARPSGNAPRWRGGRSAGRDGAPAARARSGARGALDQRRHELIGERGDRTRRGSRWAPCPGRPSPRRPARRPTDPGRRRAARRSRRERRRRRTERGERGIGREGGGDGTGVAHGREQRRSVRGAR